MSDDAGLIPVGLGSPQEMLPRRSVASAVVTALDFLDGVAGDTETDWSFDQSALDGLPASAPQISEAQLGRLFGAVEGDLRAGVVAAAQFAV